MLGPLLYVLEFHMTEVFGSKIPESCFSFVVNVCLEKLVVALIEKKIF